MDGGVESVVMNYYRNIDKSKVQFHFICDEDSTDIPYDEIEKLGGKVIVVPPYQKLFKYQKELYKIFKENKYKIVHSHINALSVFPLRVAKKAGVPIRIAHSHTTSNKKEWKRNLAKNILRPFSKVYSNQYLSCSKLAGKWLFGKKAFLDKKIKIINNAIDLEKFKFNKEKRNEIRKEIGLDEDTFLVGHIGRFVTVKNHEFLLDIFNEIHKKEKNSKLILIGRGPLKKNIDRKINELGIKEEVIFTGQINNVSDYYNAIDVFLLPSFYEGLPVVGIEAQANGILCKFSSNMT
ncbi:MAG: glycosyltransferase family 1 protein, partial [Clostridiales bacterium]|nr:glycosyltransferase family 1 protein [Clostridiales bacterium]